MSSTLYHPFITSFHNISDQLSLVSYYYVPISSQSCFSHLAHASDCFWIKFLKINQRKPHRCLRPHKGNHIDVLDYPKRNFANVSFKWDEVDFYCYFPSRSTWTINELHWVALIPWICLTWKMRYLSTYTWRKENPTTSQWRWLWTAAIRTVSTMLSCNIEYSGIQTGNRDCPLHGELWRDYQQDSIICLLQRTQDTYFFFGHE
jgi:hypothetical protein